MQDQPLSPSEEIDIRQVFEYLKNGFYAALSGLLQFYLYLRKRIYILLGLTIAGVLIGYGLNQVITKKMKTEVIVKPQVESKNYLYDVIKEIQANIEAKDEMFFQKLDIDLNELEGFEVAIEPLSTSSSEEIDLEDQIQYMETLGKFANTGWVSEVLQSEVYDRSTFNYRVIFFYKNAEEGHKAAKRIMEYINTNAYFLDLLNISKENAKQRIARNEELLNQIDQLIQKYTSIVGSTSATETSKVILSEEEKMDVTGLLNLKRSLISDIEQKKVELINQKDPINIINFGNPQEVKKAIYGKNVVLFPLLFIGLYFLIGLVKFLDTKAKALNS